MLGINLYLSAPTNLKYILVAVVILLSACGGGDGDNGNDQVEQFSIGGTVSGLNGAGLALQNNGGDTLSISTDGGFTFPTALNDLSHYSVTVSTQPTGQICSITNDSGTLAGADINNVAIDCTVKLPPNPKNVAPPLDKTSQTNFHTATSFLYTGSDPIQGGVSVGTIEDSRVAIIRGKILDRSGGPVSAVSIKIKDHPEYGSTLSRADGLFDMAVNGGGQFVIEYTHADFLTLYRDVTTNWREYVYAPDVVMIGRDTNVTKIDLASATAIQMARGSSITDQDGTRQATVLFPQGTSATMTLPGGGSQDLPVLNLRLTEYTVGESGPEAMPAPLPPGSGYTYAVDISVDEALAANATRVDFNQPVAVYLENFMGFPVGTAVPVGFYNTASNEWEAEDDGVIIEIVSVTNGLANIDVDGSGSAADPATLVLLGVTDAERRQLATLYSVSDTLWRVRLSHVSIWDFNWKFKIPQPIIDFFNDPIEEADNQNPDCVNEIQGSIIECETQTLGQRLPVTGTPFTLNYRSNRVLGRLDQYQLDIPVTGDTIPAELLYIDLEVHVAGQIFKDRIDALPNQIYTFKWDGMDAYGRRLNGSQRTRIRLGYASPGEYAGDPADLETRIQSFGQVSGTPFNVDRRRNIITLWRDYITVIGTWDARVAQLGGWSLSPHHYLDIPGETLYFGDGSRRSNESRNLNALKRLYPTSDFDPDDIVRRPRRLDIMPDGRVLVTDGVSNRIYTISPENEIVVIAGNGELVDASNPDNGDGGISVDARVSAPGDVVADNNGGFYLLESNTSDIRYVNSQGIIQTITNLPNALAIDLNPDGELFVLTGGTAKDAVYKIDSAGNAVRIAGGGPVVNNALVDDVPATESGFRSPSDIAFDTSGNLYIADTAHNRIRRVAADGIITSIAGTDNPAFQSGIGDGGPATSALVEGPNYLAFGRDGALYIHQGHSLGDNRVRKVDSNSIITTVAGNGGTAGGNAAEEGLATTTPLRQILGIIVNQADELLMSTGQNTGVPTDNNAFWKVANPLGIGIDEKLIASADGSLLYHFDGNGKHLRTLNAQTDATLHTFTYDPEGRLIAITDSFNNITQIERSGEIPSAIVSPDGHRTTLTANVEGYLDFISNPAGETHRVQYSQLGLLTTFTKPRNIPKSYTYNALGQLTVAPNNIGGSQTFANTSSNNSVNVTRQTTLGRTTNYLINYSEDGSQLRTITQADGTQSTIEKRADGTDISTSPAGTITTVLNTADPRFLTESMYPGSVTVEAGGLTSTTTRTRTVTLADPTNPRTMSSQTDTVTVNGRTATSVYTATDNTTLSTSPEGRQATSIINAAGQPVQLDITGIESTSLAYDTRGRLESVTQGVRNAFYTYGPDGFLGTVKDPLNRTVSFAYDLAGRVSNQNLPGNRTIEFGYDGNSNLTSLTPPGKPVHAFSYNAADLLESYNPPIVTNGGSTTYAYNADQQRTTITRPDNRAISFGYDSAGRLQQMTVPRGNYSYTYNSTGQLESITDPANGVLSYAYIGALLTSTTQTGDIAGSVGYGYDNDFRIQSISVNGAGAITFGYDDDSLVTSAGALSLAYDTGNGLLTGTTLGNVSDVYAYNTFGEVTGYSANYQNTALYDVTYTRDNLGRITTKAETIGGTTTTFAYEYDVAGRLETVQTDGSTTAIYSYDKNGNRLSKTVGATVTSGIFDNQDRLLSYGAATYTYTANGELLSKTEGSDVTQYTYDANGNLISIALPNGDQIDYVIDGQNRRIGKKINGTLVQGFLYQDQLNPVAELDGSGAVVSRFIYGSQINVPDYIIRGGNTFRVITDQLGSPRLIVDIATGTVAQRIDYDEFGNVLNDTNPEFQPFGFAGGIFDSHISLTRFGARDYDPATGRWLAKDPILFSGNTSNLYIYSYGDPVSYKDVNGENPLLCIGAAVYGIDQLFFDSKGRKMVEAEIQDLWNKAGFPFSVKNDEMMDNPAKALEKQQSNAKNFTAAGWVLDTVSIPGKPLIMVVKSWWKKAINKILKPESESKPKPKP